MTAQWQAAVTAVLDHFKVERVTLIGLSLGGCLALRAACEPRVERIIAFDVLTDFSEVVLRQTHPALRKLPGVLVKIRAGRLVNLLVKRVAKRSPVVEWGIQQGMHVTGTTSMLGQPGRNHGGRRAARAWPLSGVARRSGDPGTAMQASPRGWAKFSCLAFPTWAQTFW